MGVVDWKEAEEEGEQQPAGAGAREGFSKRLPRGSSCLICKRGKRKCDGQRPTCGRCRRVGCTCVYSQGGSTRTATETSVRARSERGVGVSAPRELVRAASLVRAPSDWVVGGALSMAQTTGSMIEAFVRMKFAGVLDISKAKAFLDRIEPTLNGALGNDTMRYFRALLESEVRREDSADAATSAGGALAEKRPKTAAGIAHVLLSLEDQGSIWFRICSGIEGSLDVTVSDAMAKLFFTAEELATMIKVSQLAPCYTWFKFIEPDSIATAVDALIRTMFERNSNNTRYVMIQCQTRQGLSVRCHASIAWSVEQAASTLVMRLNPMVRLSRLSPDYHYITPHTLIAVAEPDPPVCGPSACEVVAP